MGNFVTFLAFILFFSLGRYYERVKTQNARAEIEKDCLQIKQIAKELSAYDDYLKRKELKIRKNHQNAVVDISRYVFSQNPTPSKWTPVDDQYLSSWISAEPNEE